jgi:FolB domain-containing protein
VSDVIELRGLRVCAIVGVLAEEREREQPLLIDIDFERPFRDAAVSDDLAATTNYADVIVVAERIIVEGRFLLLETLVHRVAAAVLEFDRAIESVHVRAHKLRPPVPHDIATVGVSCTVRRES